MKKCLVLAKKGTGKVSPNPLVGCVIVGPDQEIVGQGYHAYYGGPHAEVNAINDSIKGNKKQLLKESVLYVNLEPCSHFGKTPPCADLILETGIPEVVIGMQDPNPIVAGSGIAKLRSRGVKVRVGVDETVCRRLNEAFIHQLSTGRPLVVLKVAQTLDGAIATKSGKSQWISDLASRRRVHRWRSELDAVLVGRGTALQDNPALTVRLVKGRNPLRIILDRKGTLPGTLQVFTDALVDHTIVVHSAGHPPPYKNLVAKAGGRFVEAPADEERSFLESALFLLGQKPFHVQSVLVEAGPGLASALIRENLVDRFYAFIAPKLFGGGTPVFYDLGIEEVEDAYRFVDSSWTRSGKDILFKGYVRDV